MRHVHQTLLILLALGGVLMPAPGGGAMACGQVSRSCCADGEVRDCCKGCCGRIAPGPVREPARQAPVSSQVDLRLVFVTPEAVTWRTAREDHWLAYCATAGSRCEFMNQWSLFELGCMLTI